MKDLDRIAMAAMQGMLSNSSITDVSVCIAYDIAEAMLEESKKRSNNDLTYEDD